MLQHDEIKQYTNSVCEQIRWKKAHSVISRELENHIDDQKNAFIAEGFDEAAASEKAIQEMGDPITVGAQFDRTHRPKTEWSMIILTLFLLLIGIAVNYFIKSSLPYTDELYFFRRTTFTTALGVICMLVAYFLDFTIIGKYPKTCYTLLIALTIASLPFTHAMNGVHQWIMVPIFGSISIMVVLLLFPTLFAGIICCMRNKGYRGIILCVAAYSIPVVLLLGNKQLTRVLLYMLTCIILLSLSIYKGWFNVNRLYGILITLMPAAFCGFLILGSGSIGYIISRIAAAFNPSSDYYGWGYIRACVREVLHGAKFIGQGSAIDITLPSKNTDYLITSLIHDAGWVSFIVIAAILTVFIIRGFYLCSKQKNVLGRLVSTSVLLTLTMQVIVYISANLGLQIFSQTMLPFITYGGMTGVVNLILVGIMLSIFKTGDLILDNVKITQAAKSKIIEFTDGKLIIDFNTRKWLH